MGSSEMGFRQTPFPSAPGQAQQGVRLRSARASHPHPRDLPIQAVLRAHLGLEAERHELISKSPEIP